MSIDTPSDAQLREILTTCRSFACVGVSPNPARPSHYVAQYLVQQGYRVTPVNPGQSGRVLFGQTVVGRLADIGTPVDVVDIFRRPEVVPDIVDEVLAHMPGVKVIWMQIGVTHPQAAAKARAAGLTVIQDLCPKQEHRRLFGA
jgi:predicted CoA-binding protein